MTKKVVLCCPSQHRRCLRGKPASDKSHRKESEPNKGKERPSIYGASVSFYGDNPPHGKLQEILVAEGERFGLSGVFEPPTG